MKLLLENWREYLDEVEDFDAITTSQDEIQQSLDYFYNEHAPSKGEQKDLGNWHGHQMVSFELPAGDLFFFAVNEQDKPLMYLSVAPFRESYAVRNVRKIKGAGFYATDMYKWLVEKFGSLYSDKAQTEGGKGIWERFPNKEKVPTEEDGEGKWRWRLSK